jgi:hypothetical protein
MSRAWLSRKDVFSEARPPKKETRNSAWFINQYALHVYKQNND